MGRTETGIGQDAQSLPTPVLGADVSLSQLPKQTLASEAEYCSL